MASEGVKTTENAATPSAVAADVYSPKVFVGGLPLDSTPELISSVFSKFGDLTIEWPARKTKNFPGYAFLVFKAERSVSQLVENCYKHKDDLFFPISSKTAKNKPAHVRPWKVEDARYISNPDAPLVPRRTIFIGGVPKGTRAGEIAAELSRVYGAVCFLEILVHPETLYPSGAVRAVFIEEDAFIAAMKGKFLELPESGVMKRIRIKPYLTDEQTCDECGGVNSSDVKAQYFCEDASCLQYFCETCWDRFHNAEVADRARFEHKPYVRINGEVKLMQYPPHHSCDCSKTMIDSSGEHQYH